MPGSEHRTMLATAVALLLLTGCNPTNILGLLPMAQATVIMDASVQIPKLTWKGKMALLSSEVATYSCIATTGTLLPVKFSDNSSSITLTSVIIDFRSGATKVATTTQAFNLRLDAAARGTTETPPMIPFDVWNTRELRDLTRPPTGRDDPDTWGGSAILGTWQQDQLSLVANVTFKGQDGMGWPAADIKVSLPVLVDYTTLDLTGK